MFALREDVASLGTRMEHPDNALGQAALLAAGSFSVLEPMGDNPRLVSQAGLLTKQMIALDLESWVRLVFRGLDEVILLKVTIPGSHRETALRSLNLMNINHKALFPDLGGAAQYCNLGLEFEGY